MSVDSMLSDTAQIIKYQEKSSGWNSSEVIIETITVNCRFKDTTSKKVFLAANEKIIPNARIYLPFDTNITEADRIKYKDNLYEIISPINNAGLKNKFLQLDLRRML